MMTMSAATLLSEHGTADGVGLQRADGRARLVIGRSGTVSRLERLFQEGAAKVRFPKVPAGAPPEAVLINTAGGLTGGDRFSVDADIGEGASAIVTSQACEKIYRSSGGAARVENRLNLRAGAACAWLPQETILFDQARLERRLHADMAADARLLAVEPLILGRTAMGESVRRGRMSDRWRIRRGGRLLHADDFRLEGDIGHLSVGAPLLAGHRAAAVIVLVSPDAEDHLDAVRDLLGDADDPTALGGASAWGGRLSVRLLADTGQTLRSVLVPLVRMLLARLTSGGEGGAALPRVWTT